MNLRDLRYVVAVAEAGHFGRAAERCHVSQPTLSAQIAKLEERIGVQLFERLPREVRVTRSGHEILLRARRIVQDADELLEHARQLQNPMSGRLSLGFIPTVGPYLIPHILKPLKRTFSELEILPAERQSADCLKLLDSGELDAAVLALPFTGAERFVQKQLYEEAFELLAPTKHSLAKRETISTNDLKDSRLLLLEQGHCLRDHALAFCRFSGALDDYRATSLETLKNIVATGVGVTLLPELAARDVQDPDLVTRGFNSPAPGRSIVMLYRKSCPKLQAIEAVSSLICSLNLPLRGKPLSIPD